MILLRDNTSVEIGGSGVEISSNLSTPGLSHYYLRVGDMQVCWGYFGSFTSGGYYWNAFAASFSDTSYGLTMLAIDATVARSAQVHAKSSAGIFSQSYAINGTRTSSAGRYIAVGRWR